MAMKSRALTMAVLLTACGFATAQLDARLVSDKFEAYRSAWKTTRLALILNQEKFAPGDTVWLKAYFLDDDFRGITGRQKIELNLVDWRGRSRAHSIINVSYGVGYNQIIIPESLEPGLYLLTAHSSWMRNFRPMPFFKKEITIVTQNAVVADEEFSVFARPEGGHLVAGIPNRVACRVQPAPSQIEVLDSASQEVAATASADSLGFGALVFTPTPERRYVLRTGDGNVNFAFPPVEEDGCSLLVSAQAGDGPVSVRIMAPVKSSFRRVPLLLVLTARSHMCYSRTVDLASTSFEDIVIDRRSLPEGIIHAALLNAEGSPIASRDFYIAPKGDTRIEVSMSKETFKPREPVRMEISLQDGTSAHIQAEFSVSVVNEGVAGTETMPFLEDMLALFPREGSVIERSVATRPSALDNLLICESRDLPWRQILSDHPPVPTFRFTNAIEKRGIALSGDEKPVPDFTQILFYLQHDKMHYQTFTVHGGHVRLTLPDIFGPDEFLYVAETQKGRPVPDLRIRWQDDSIPLPVSRRSHEADDDDPYARFAQHVKMINRSYHYYGIERRRGNDERAIGAESFEEEIGGADVTVRVQDYVAMSTMSELIREVVPSVYMRGSGDNSGVRINLPEPLYPAMGDPVYIIDGIATHNTRFFLSLPPPSILTIKVVTDAKKLAPFKLMGKNGIIIVETKSGNVREPLADQAREVEGLSMPAPFHAPDFRTDPRRRIPDFRSIVYWNPSVKTDADGKASVEFACSDDEGKLRIRIDGLTADGHPFSCLRYAEIVSP